MSGSLRLGPKNCTDQLTAVLQVQLHRGTFKIFYFKGNFCRAEDQISLT